MSQLAFDMIPFVLYCILAAFLFRTRRGSRLMGILSAAVAVIGLAQSMDHPRNHLLPPAWQFDIPVGLLVLAFLIFSFGTMATFFRHRQPQ